MARQKKPENETNDQADARRALEIVANHANRSEKTSWSRKQKNMEKLLARLSPYDEQLLNLLAHKQLILDEVAVLRDEMVDDCVHPYDLLVMKEGYVECKFCNRKLNVNQFNEK